MYLYSTSNIHSQFLLHTPDYDAESTHLMCVSHEVQQVHPISQFVKVSRTWNISSRRRFLQMFVHEIYIYIASLWSEKIFGSFHVRRTYKHSKRQEHRKCFAESRSTKNLPRQYLFSKFHTAPRMYQNVTSYNLLKPTGHVMHQQFNIQQLYVLPTLYLCVLCLSENKQRFVLLTA